MKKDDLPKSTLSNAFSNLRETNPQLFKNKEMLPKSIGYANLPKMAQPDTSKLAKIMEDMNRVEALKERQKVEREVHLNQMIEQIVQNTAYLPEMVGLIRKNNELNEEMLELFQEMTNVLKAKSKEEAENVVLEVIDKAKKTNDALDAIAGLVNYGKLLIKLMFPESS